MDKIGKSVVLLGRLIGLLLKTGLALMKNVLKPLAKSVLIPLGLTSAVPATDAVIYNKMFGLGTKKIINWNEEINDIMSWK